jgi:hypothetical protein
MTFREAQALLDQPVVPVLPTVTPSPSEEPSERTAPGSLRILPGPVCGAEEFENFRHHVTWCRRGEGE